MKVVEDADAGRVVEQVCFLKPSKVSAVGQVPLEGLRQAFKKPLKRFYKAFKRPF